MARAADEFGGIDILVNNAGIQHVSAVCCCAPGNTYTRPSSIPAHWLCISAQLDCSISGVRPSFFAEVLA